MEKTVYVSGALMNVPDLNRARQMYAAFAAACRKASWRAYLPHTRTDPEFSASLSPESVAKRDLGELGRADVVLAYLGEPSLGVGAEIAVAINQGKRILAIHESGRRVSRFILGLLHDYSSAAVFAFDSEKDACEWITQSLVRYRGDDPPQEVS